MSLFFYRAYAGLNNNNNGGEGDWDPFKDQIFAQFQFHRWGYAVLLAFTMVAGILLNAAFILAFFGNKNIRKLPHWALLMLSVRGKFLQGAAKKCPNERMSFN